jgi:Tfp pilus assembly protein PilF
MPKNSSVLNNLAYMLAQSDRRLPEALEHAKKAVEQEPDEANYLDTYGYVLHKNGKHVEAAQALTAAIQQYEVGGTAPAEVHEHLGMVHEALGERNKALVAYRRALELGGNSMSDVAKGRLNSAIARLTP